MMCMFKLSFLEYFPEKYKELYRSEFSFIFCCRHKVLYFCKESFAESIIFDAQRSSLYRSLKKLLKWTQEKSWHDLFERRWTSSTKGHILVLFWPRYCLSLRPL